MSPEMTSNKILYIVRNPLDVIVSVLNFLNTVNHANKPSFEFQTTYPQYWQEMVKYWTGVLNTIFKTYIEQAGLKGK